MAIQEGDLVQIKKGAIDINNTNKRATGNKSCEEGGPQWATVTKIMKNWRTGGKGGLPPTVTKYTCKAGNITWDVQDKDMIVKATKADMKKAMDAKTAASMVKKSLLGAYKQEDQDTKGKNKKKKNKKKKTASNGTGYAPGNNKNNNWTNGPQSIEKPFTQDIPPEDLDPEDAVVSESMFSNDAGEYTPYYGAVTIFGINFHNMTYVNKEGIREKINKKKAAKIIQNKTSQRIYVPNTPYRANYLTSWDEPGRRAEMLNGELADNGVSIKASSRIKNGRGYPKLIKYSGDEKKEKDIRMDKGEVLDYDYQIIPGDDRLRINNPKNKDYRTLEYKLMTVRAAFGLSVHGDNDIARSMKFYMYNRYKVPDTNLAFNRLTTHIFFTRPDLNILDPTRSKFINDQVANHSESALLWRRYPELFKLLTDNRRCGDKNNFNMLLSNNVSSFNITDDGLSTMRAGKTWREYEIFYGKTYTGRTGGEFTCTFDETSELSIINLMKFWITYIDNVSHGAWSPNYETMRADGKKIFDHSANRDIDYAASMYVFKCGPDGEDVLYWTKYYGVFPISTGSGALSWERSSPIGQSPMLTITFAYSWKEDLEPMSLLDFNANAHVDVNDLNMGWVPAFNKYHAGSTRPFVGTPYIEITLPDSTDVEGAKDGLLPDDDVSKSQRASIRLKFLDDARSVNNNAIRGDRVLFMPQSGLSQKVPEKKEETEKTEPYYYIPEEYRQYSSL